MTKCRRRRGTVSTTAINFAVLCLVVFSFTALPKIEATSQCRIDQFPCGDGRHCVQQRYRCDGDRDCNDGSDEAGCDASVNDNFLLVSVVRDSESSTQIRPQVYQVDLSTGGTAKPLLPTDRSNPASMAVDGRRRILYYVDKNTEAIMRLSIDHLGNSSRVIYRAAGSNTELDGLALDSSTQRLYFCDAGNDPKVAEISIANPGESLRTIHSGRNLKPKSIVVDEANKELYWTDWGSAPGIFVIGIEPGAQKRALIVHNIITPNAIAIDFKEGLMYWADAQLDRIEVANLNGQQRAELWRHSDHQEVHHYAMAIGPEYLYICDWASGNVKKLHRRNRIISNQLPSISGKKTGIVYYNTSYNNTGTRRPERVDVLNRVTSSAVTSKSMTLPVTTAKPTKDKASSTPEDAKSTKINDIGTLQPEKLQSIDGSQAKTLAIAVVCSLVTFVVLLSLVAWCGIRKHKLKRASVSGTNSLATLSDTRSPLWSSPSGGGGGNRVEDSYVRLPSSAIVPYESGENGEWYQPLNEYAEAPGYGSPSDGIYYAVKENNEQELVVYDDIV